MNLCDYVDFEIVEIIRWEGCVPSVFSASGVFNTHAEKMAVFPQILLFELLLISLSVAERQLSEPEVLNNSTIVDPSPPFNDDAYNVLLSTKEKYHIPLIGKRSVDQTLPRVRREDKSVFTQFDSKLKLETNKENKKVIRIGHLGATGIMPNDAKVLNASKMELIENGLIPPSLEFEIVSRITCSESYEGVAVAAELYHTHQVRAFIGPYCSAELESVVKMATFWNIPIISYSSTSNSLTDRNIYKTLARISSKNVNAIAEATVALLQHYKWTKIGIITNTGVEAFERVQVFEEILHRVGITVLRKVMLEESARSTEIISSGLLSEMAGSARIIVCMFSNTLDLSKEVMKATKILEINNAEYAYVIPWMQGGAKDTSPWIGADGEMLQKVKDDYANAIIVDDVNGFDDSIVTSFLSKLEKYGVTKNELDLSNIYGYIHLYDSLKLYALAIKKTLEESGNEAFVTNGQYIWNKMRRTSFEGVVTTSDNQTDGDTKTGAIGTVIMDDLVDRAPIFAAFYISPKRSDVLKMVNINSELMSNCDGLKNRSGCFNLNITDITRDFWISENGALPLDEPVCGYKGQKCSYLMEILFGVIALVLVILAVGAHTLYRICETRALDKMPWRVFHEDLQFIDDEQVKSMMSVSSANTKISNMSVGQKRHVIIGVNTHSTYHKYVQRRPIKFGREDLQLLSQMKQCVHDNINPFLGMAFNEKEEMLILWKFCSRGTVQDIIYNKNVILDEKFHAAFVRDITLGLEYLHASSIGYHGSLTPWACLIDRNWMVKLSDYGIANPLERWDQQGAITIELPVDADDKSQASQKTSVLYCAPEMLKTKASNSKRRMDQSWIKQSQLRRQAGDIYSFGMVMYEILFRSLPYKQGTDYSELCDYLSDGSKIITPEIQDQMGCHPDLQALLRDCWSENPEIRPSIRRVRLNTEMVLKTKGSLVDQMMRMMEQYANNLEKTVKERTGMLEDANIRADQLLSQLLPKYVANELKLGRAVAPKLFSSATVLFSDIVGFTTICSSSSPLEVVTMLNGLYTGFDECITRNESYKVETIGDAYMVVSGVPEENGYNHSRNIANVALDMRQYLNSYKVPHRPSHRIRCRWGFHTGSVAAGVVGMTAPRYCLFGDTVNTASRMESSGTPGMVQLSDEAHHHLANHWPIFSLTPRGEIEVKGKGKVMTYWLEDRIGDENTANYINEENQ